MMDKEEPWLKEMADILEKEITGGKDHIDVEKISRTETYEGDYLYSKVDQEPLDLNLDQIRRKFEDELQRWGSVGLPIICHNC
jgi:hypothetical protein